MVESKMKEETENELLVLKLSLKALDDKFSLFTTVILFALALQVAGAIYTGISVKDSTNEFIKLKTQQFNQIVANEKLDPKIKFEFEDLLDADVLLKKNQHYLRFSIGIENFGVTPASGLVIRVLLPEKIKTKYQSFERDSYPFESVARPSKGDLYIPSNATFRQGVNIPIDQESVSLLKAGEKVEIIVLLYSKFGLEDERSIKLSINKRH